MNKIYFSHDYMKLPAVWDGSHAVLIGVQYIPDMDRFKKQLPQLVRADTMFRGEDGFYPLNFKEGILLIFFHLNSCELFTTIRRFTKEKFQYYEGSRQETFELMRVVEK
jgi:hypothetical protein